MMAEYLSDDRRQFKNEELQNHAIFLLQYLVHGEEKSGAKEICCLIRF